MPEASLQDVEAVRVAIFVMAGLAIGSFLTVVSYRLPRRQSVVKPRSACPGCGKTIRSRDNVPVVSYLLLRGRCRGCGVRISLLYPLTEALTGGLFAAAALTFDRTLVAAMVAVFLGVVLAAAVIDARHRIIPNRLVYAGLIGFSVVLVAGRLAGQGTDPFGAAAGFLAFGGGLLVVALISPRGMGMGDVKLAALIGLVLGSLGMRYVAVAAGAAILAGGLGAVVVLLAGRGGRKQAIPFGPYLAAGAVVSTFAAPQIAQAYLHLVG
ncbi:MAG: A24 family peptidase [Actinomycetota bacterium]